LRYFVNNVSIIVSKSKSDIETTLLWHLASPGGKNAECGGYCDVGGRWRGMMRVF